MNALFLLNKAHCTFLTTGGSGSPTSVREGQGDSRDSSSSSSASDTTDSGTWPSSEPGGLRGGDAYVVVGLTLAEAATGVEREVVASVQGACQACEVSEYVCVMHHLVRVTSHFVW
jgi:hypothetical protein